MKVLVTGGAGYIGSTTAKALEEAGHTPGILDSLLTGHLYVNIHTATYPAGEIRGQVLPGGGWGFASTLDIHQEGSATHDALPDPRIKTAVAIGPWGKQNDFWDAEGLAGIEVPMLFIAGSADTVSQYETGVRAIWEGARNVDRALLTFEKGSHNTVAPIPAPEESLGLPSRAHYTDPEFDTVFMNNVGQHFVTAWLDTELKGALDRAAYLDLVPNGADGVYSVNPDGSFAADHSYWTGFQPGTADRLRYEVLAPVPLPASALLLVMGIGGLGAARAMRGRRG